MTSFNFTITGVAAALAGLQGLDTKAHPAVARGITRGVLAGQGIARKHASGRPGPRVISGDFRRSITGDTFVGGPTVLGSIGSGAPQARRLEYGFVGADSLGRVYNQPPYPWLTPAVPEISDAILEAVTAELEKAFA